MITNLADLESFLLTAPLRHSDRETAALFACSHMTVCRVRERLGVAPAVHPRRRESKRTQIRVMLADSDPRTLLELAAEVGSSYSSAATASAQWQQALERCARELLAEGYTRAEVARIIPGLSRRALALATMRIDPPAGAQPPADPDTEMAIIRAAVGLRPDGMDTTE